MLEVPIIQFNLDSIRKVFSSFFYSWNEPCATLRFEFLSFSFLAFSAYAVDWDCFHHCRRFFLRCSVGGFYQGKSLQSQSLCVTKTFARID